MNVHKNARLTPRGRERIVRQVAGGQTPEAVAEAAGVCSRTVRKWVDRHRREGLAGLQDRSSRPPRSRSDSTSFTLGFGCVHGQKDFFNSLLGLSASPFPLASPHAVLLLHPPHRTASGFSRCGGFAPSRSIDPRWKRQSRRACLTTLALGRSRTE